MSMKVTMEYFPTAEMIAEILEKRFGWQSSSWQNEVMPMKEPLLGAKQIFELSSSPGEMLEWGL